jgi:hypothetical protein
MNAITTRYLGATAHRPARILATDQDGNRQTLPADGDFPYTDRHQAAAVALCQSMRWPGAETLVGGTVKGGMVWVFPEPTAPLEDRVNAKLAALAAALQDRATAPTAARCGEAMPVDLMAPRGKAYRCSLPPGHGGAHVDERHPMHPSWT